MTKIELDDSLDGNDEGGINRRDFLRLGGMISARLAAGSSVFALGCDLTPYGPLQAPDANGLRLPPRFSSRIIAVSTQVVAGTSHIWHNFPDGGATFATRTGGWIYVSNSEAINPGAGGVGAIEFNSRGNIVDAYPILSGTRRNCAGGKTPWGTWLSCEEWTNGLVYECDPTGANPAAKRKNMGRFMHEAVAVDSIGHVLYMTEDRPTGGLYRYTPNTWMDLSDGLLEIAEVDAGNNVIWHTVPDPLASEVHGQTATRYQVPESYKFNGGEGIVYSLGKFFFTTKYDNKVWEYDPRAENVRVLYNGGQLASPILSGVDNIEASRRGDLYVAEDGGGMELVVLSRGGVTQPLLRIMDSAGSEVTGPAFSPWGDRLYFSSQRGTLTERFGRTYEVTGPFR